MFSKKKKNAGGENQKEESSEAKEAKKDKYPEAKEVVFKPYNFEEGVSIKKEKLKQFFLNELVEKDFIFNLDNRKERKENPDEFNNIMNDFLSGDGDALKVVVHNVTPNETAKITKNTKVILNENKATPQDIPENKKIRVTHLPDLKNYFKVKSFEELVKIVRGGYLLNVYQTPKKTVYFVDPYYYEEKNQKEYTK